MSTLAINIHDAALSEWAMTVLSDLPDITVLHDSETEQTLLGTASGEHQALDTHLPDHLDGYISDRFVQTPYPLIYIGRPPCPPSAYWLRLPCRSDDLRTALDRLGISRAGARVAKIPIDNSALEASFQAAASTSSIHQPESQPAPNGTGYSHSSPVDVSPLGPSPTARQAHQIGFWSPKGGAGASSIAINTAAASLEYGLRCAFADFDPTWTDSLAWFDDRAERPDERHARWGGHDPEQTYASGQDTDALSPLASYGPSKGPSSPEGSNGSGIKGLRPIIHPSGLRGFISRSADDVSTMQEGLRAGFDLVVIDTPSSQLPIFSTIDKLYVVVSCDLPALRRARIAIAALAPQKLPLSLVLTIRKGAELKPDEVGSALAMPVEATFPDEPALVSCADRGAMIYPLKRSRWSRELRRFTAAICEELEKGGDK